MAQTVHTAEIPCWLGGTSTTTHEVSNGEKTFALVAGSPIPLVGMTLRAEETVDPDNWVEGIVTAADEDAATIWVTSNGGVATSVSAWTFTDGVMRFSSVVYLHPDATVPYEPYIEQPATYGRGITLDGPRSQSEYGNMVVTGLGGRFDRIIRYGYGRSAGFYIGTTADAPGDLTRYLSPVVDDCVPGDFETIVFKLVGREAELDVLAQAARFGGTNSGSTGIDGLPGDIAGSVKARLWGACENVTPQLVNSVSRISGVNFDRDGTTAAISSMAAARDNEDTLTADGDQADLAALQADAIVDGHWDSCLAEGLLRLGGTTFRGLTVDAVEGAGAGDRTVARITEDIVGEIIDPADISAADLTALDVASSAVVGIYVPDEQTVDAIIDQLAPSAGAKWGFDKDGVFRIARLALPSGTPAYTFKRVTLDDVLKADEGDILELLEGPFSDETSTRPYKRVNLLYRRNFTPRTDGDIKDTTAGARAAFAKLEYRTVTAPADPADEAAVLAKYPNAGELTVTTLLTDAVSAQAEADRLFEMRRERRDVIKIAVKFGSAIAGAIDIGSVVALEMPRFGYDAGKLFRVLFISYDPANLTAVLTLWGGVAP